MGRQTFSQYEVFSQHSGKRLAIAASIVDEFALKDHLKRQAVHFSPSGNTIVIDEDASDASDWVAYTLITRRNAGELFSVGELTLPVRDTHSSYGEWPVVVSVTDSEVFYRYEGDTTSRCKKL